MRFVCGGNVFLPESAVSLWLQFVVVLVSMGLGHGYECGGFIGMSSSSTGTFQSPGYPGNYPNYTRCIWILETPEQYTPKLVVNFQGETYASACSDYVEFRDGGQTGQIINSTCSTMTSETVASTGRWMYVFFTSDGISQATGLSATYSALYVGSSVNNTITSPISSCRSYEFECSNRLCLSMSYRCDGYYDCGCGSDCDEDGCGGLPISKSARMGIGFGVGIAVFLVVAALGLLLEKRHNWEKEKSTQQTKNESNSRRQGWTSKRNAKAGADYTPDPSQPASARIPPCTIKVSEVV